jgi:hypothetical protein
MYLHESLLREGFELTPHPEVAGTTSRPDFRARRDEVTIYLEATVIGASASETASERRRNVVYDSLNQLDSPNFFLWLDVDKEGPSSPSARQLRRDLSRWLGTLDPDEVAATLETGGLDAAPTHVWEAAGWRVIFRPIPKRAEARGKPGARPVGAFGPGRAMSVDGVGQVKSDLEDKASKYGKPDLPFVIAVAIESPFFDPQYTMSGALFGREAVQFDPETLESRSFRHPNGLWRGPRGPRNTRVSAVVAMRNVGPWNVIAHAPVTWHNPWAALPMPDVLPWASARVDLQTGELIGSEAARPPHEVLGLPEGWPGPEDPYPDVE